MAKAASRLAPLRNNDFVEVHAYIRRATDTRIRALAHAEDRSLTAQLRIIIDRGLAALDEPA